VLSTVVLKTVAHNVEKPRFPIVDYHHYLDSQKPDELLKVTDYRNVEFVVNITMRAFQAI
jgi:hypothetical protein